MRGLLNRLNNSTRNSAVYRSVNLKVLNREKSTFLKPESRKMFLLMLPYVFWAGGVMTELPTTKQPPAPSVPRGSAAWARHCFHMLEAEASEELIPAHPSGLLGVVSEPAPQETSPLMPLVTVQPVPLPAPPGPVQ